jgi:hypothetical protein
VARAEAGVVAGLFFDWARAARPEHELLPLALATDAAYSCRRGGGCTDLAWVRVSGALWGAVELADAQLDALTAQAPEHRAALARSGRLSA